MPMFDHGRLVKNIEESYRIKKSDILFTNYTSYSDIFKDKLPVYPLSLGTRGSYNMFSMFGGKGNANTFSFNGRSLSYSEYSTYNF